MTSEDVAFYARLKEVQEVQHKREQKRMDLQRRFDDYVTSDHRLSRLKAVRLQSYWKKVCEDERKSKARNEQLLRDFERVEAHIATLSSRTERLKLVKDQYESQVETMFPYWKEQLEIKRQAQEAQDQQAANMPPLSAPYQHLPHQAPMHHTSAAQNGVNSLQNGSYHQEAPSQFSYIHSMNGTHPGPLTSTHPEQPSLAQAPSNGSQSYLYHQPPPSTTPQSSPGHPNNGVMYGFGVPQVPQHYDRVPPGHPGSGPVGGLHQQQLPSGAAGGRVVPGSSTQGPPVPQVPGHYDRVPPGHPVSGPVGGLHQQQLPSGAAGGRVVPGGSTQGQPVPQVPGHYDRVPPGHPVSGPVGGLHQQQLPSEVAGGRVVPGSSTQGPPVTIAPEDSTSISISSDPPSSPMHQLKPAMPGQHASQPHAHSGLGAAGGNSIPPQGTVLPRDEAVGAVKSDKQDIISNITGKSIHSERNQMISKQAAEVPYSGLADKPPSALTEPFSSSEESEDESEDEGEKLIYSPEVPPELPNYEEARQVPAREGNAPQTQHRTKEPPQPVAVVPPVEPLESSGSEEDSELDSDISLPLSGTDSKPVPAARTSTQAKPSSEEAADPNRMLLTTDGFWLLLRAVEAEIDETDSLEGIYASLPCTKNIRDEIVRTANAKKSFDHLDPRAISMTILGELPLLVRQLPGGCLLSERLLLSSSRNITENSIRSHMYSSALKFWDDILRHMVFLVRRGVMEPETVAAKFAPLLVSAESNAVEKAINVISDMLLKAEEEEEVTLGDESSLTETSHMSPDNPAATPDIIPHAQPDQPNSYPSVPPLSLGGMEGDTDDLVDTGRASNDSFFDNKVPLTETSAYQRMMMGAQPDKGRESRESLGRDDSSEEEEDSEDSEDEIEKAAGIKQDSPTSHHAKKKRNVLSSLGGSLGMTGDSMDDSRQEDGARGDGLPFPSDRTDEVSSPEKSEAVSSPSLSPQGAGGYVPSAMEHSMKSTGRTDTMNRSAAFWGNESDLDDESEMSVPMGTGKVEEKDDFDFYD